MKRQSRKNNPGFIRNAWKKAWKLAWAHKRLWLVPFVIVVAVVAALTLFVGNSTTIAPLLYILH